MHFSEPPNFGAAASSHGSVLPILALAIAGALATIPLSSSAQNVIAWGDNTFGQTNVPPSATNVISISVGGFHTLALRSDGSVVAWGQSSNGKTNVPASATNIVAVAAGGNHSLALSAGGTVIGWGLNASGQSTAPPQVTNAVSIAAGANHSLALLVDGTLVAWGNNSSGQTSIPAGATNIVSIGAAGDHSVALRADGAVFSCGRMNFRSPQVPYFANGVLAVFAGYTHDIAFDRNGKILFWGPSDVRVPTNAFGAISLAAGTNYCLAVMPDSTVIGWGKGSGSSPSLSVPASATNVVAVGAGLNFCAALIGNGPPALWAPLQSGNSAPAGNSLPLYARVTGALPLHYLWLSNDVSLGAADSPLPGIPAVLGNDQLAYRVVVSNSMGSVTSSVATISVGPVCAWGDNANHPFDVPANASNLVAVAAGGSHSLGLSQNGTVYAWGKNTDGQASVPPEATNVVAIAAGSDHSVALKGDGTVLAWGGNWSGQTNLPAGATNLVAVSAGWGHTLALRADGRVLAWGDDTYSQCDVSFLADSVISIAAGGFHSLALKSDGTVVSWGNNIPVSPDATNVIAIAAGAAHSLALRADGSVVAWGDNSRGQTNVPSSATNVVAIAAGYFHSLALKSDGTVIAWGPKYINLTNPPAALTNVVAIAAGEAHCLALVSSTAQFYAGVKTVTSSLAGQAVIRANLEGNSSAFSYQWYKDGAVVNGATNLTLILSNLALADAGSYTLVASGVSGPMTNQPTTLVVQSTPVSLSGVGAWGDNYYDQCTIPPTPSGPRAIAAGAFHSLALNGDGTVSAWGNNRDGQTNVPPTVTNVIAIAAGADHSMALRADGTVIAWGRNWDGQTNVPPQATNVVAISAGRAHSVALRSDGTVLAWGNNDVDQTNVPSNLANVSRIAAGYHHTLALLSNHTVVSWGLYGPAPASATNVVAIAAGWGHSMALRADGSVVAWGDDTFGQADVPPQATNIVAVAAGFYHSLALQTDGTLLAWGRGYHGVTNVPFGLNDVAAIAAGEDYSLALRQLGPLQFTRLPESVTLHAGAPAVLAADVWASQPISLQWTHDGNALPAATNRFLLLAPTGTTDSGSYVLTASNSFSQGYSSSATVTVLGQPFVDTIPLYTNALLGQSVCLPAAISGQQPMTYQWYKDGAILHDNAQLSGSSSSVLCLSNVRMADGGDYRLAIQNTSGSYTGLVTHLSPSMILAWGDDFAGQLDMPPDFGPVVAVAAGSDHSLALKADGTVVGWGDNTFGQTSVPAGATNLVAIAAFGSQNMALRGDGVVLAWGDNDRGLTTVPASASNVMAIATSDTHSIALRADGSTPAWGTGAGLTINSLAPGPITAVAAGTWYSMALATNTVTLYGLSETFPSGITAISAGPSNQLALDVFGNVTAYAFLKNSVITQWTLPSAIGGIAAFGSGQGHLLFLETNGIPISIGDNAFGQTNVPAVASNMVAVASGYTHNLALLGSGRTAIASRAYSRTQTVGDTVCLVANSIGNAPATYQWQRNGTNIPGATTAALVLSPARWSDAGAYRAIASDAFGSATGPETDITMGPPTLQLDGSGSGVLVSSNSVQLRLQGASGTGSLVVFGTTNLVSWTPVLTNPPAGGTVILVVPITPNQQEMFYRVAEFYGP